MTISLAAEKIFQLGDFPISNSLLTTWLAVGLLIFVSRLSTKNVQLIPNGIQNIMEALIEGLYGLVESIAEKNAKKFFPLIATIFLFVITSNWLGLIPGLPAIGVFHEVEGHEEFVPLFRSPSADLNTTLALALISVVSIQFFGLNALGLKNYLAKFINFKNPINFFVGILELISEFAKIISFSFRLFGNIFAGEVLLLVIAFLIPIIAPTPFLMLEIFVGLVQAMVFAILTLVFLNVATTTHDESH